MNAHVIRAIFRRNFISYFSNPTGYVFICVFVLLSGLAAFWPYEFFNANLASLDQLNKYLPFIMLVFIPAITMSIWADERRQGTDELLLTIPAADFDVVLGKYLAAVAIFSVALMFSLISNLIVLQQLGEPDVGLFLGNYFGYWIVGLAMLAVGMVASFLTNNLTVGFILGALFNAPLVFAASAPEWLGSLRRWSIDDQFRDFGRGVISLSSLAYFLAIVALMLYLSMVLIGRRHWRGGQEGRAIAGHYAVRFLALVVVALALNYYVTNHDRARMDVTIERLNSLSPDTRKLVQGLDAKRPVQIEAYVSKSVPEAYVPTKLNLVSTLRELQRLNPDKVKVAVHEIEPFSEEAAQAEQQYGIRPTPVLSRARGARSQEDVFLAAAVTCGLDKVVQPFFGRGVPVEYELVRSIATVGQNKRKRIGVLTTDAKLYGGFDMETMSATNNELLVDELQKQYEVVQVDPASPITEKYDVLLAVQPSSLSPDQMNNFIAAVKNGQATAIFEDPLPYINRSVPGTAAPKQAGGGGMNPFMMRQPPQPKGDIRQLWQLLGVDFAGEEVIWQDYNPYPKAGNQVPREFVFIDHGVSTADPFNEKQPISSRLQQLLFLYPGAVQGLNSSPLKFTELVSTGDNTGTIKYNEVFLPMGGRDNPEFRNAERKTGERYVMAAHISGKLKNDNAAASDPPASDDPPDHAEKANDSAKDSAGDTSGNDAAKSSKSGDAKNSTAGDTAKSKPNGAKTEKKPPAESEINVVVVGDIDCLYSVFFYLRSMGNDPDDEIKWDLDNVTFVLNVIDYLAHDQRFVDIRNHRPAHRTLTKLAEATEPLRDQAEQAREKFNQEFETARKVEQKKFDDQIAALQSKKELNLLQVAQEVTTARQAGQRRLETKLETLKQRRDREVKRIERQLALEVRATQDRYKLWAVILPPIPPLLVALFVFFQRRTHEKEGVAKSRLR